ncbi:uncharacterized protein LODBEIA_P19970 [Lodderomyces beijingensis]|uniref:Uncharacterized protein n=1 Tax=Lodderomyces beijingensis TaxID=1775926 RepID=A0ABP0ZJG3_9ASCO
MTPAMIWPFFILPVLSQLVFTNAKSYTFPKFESSATYFEQSDSDISPNQVNYSHNFGLKNEYSWSDVVGQTDAYHKLFFIIRHGFGVHQCPTPSQDWTCYWQEKDGYNGQVWADALLTQQGIDECTKLNTQIKNTANLPQVDKFYVSPLRRTLQTWQHSWQGISNKSPLVVEFARETYGIQTESKRHPQSYIQANWPSVHFEDGFSANDELWSASKRETGQHRDYRAASLLNQIWDSTTEDDKVITLVSHSGLIGSILKVIGHRDYPIENAVLLPVLIQRKKHKTDDYSLDKASKTFGDICTDPPSTITEGPGLTCSAAPFTEAA